MTFKDFYYQESELRGFNEIEKELNDAYESKAPQEKIDALETELANFVSEEDMVGNEIATSEGISVEEQLRNMYARYINNKNRHGMSNKDIIENMRDIVITNGGRQNVTDEELLDAAKDVYEKFLHLKRSGGRGALDQLSGN